MLYSVLLGLTISFSKHKYTPLFSLSLSLLSYTCILFYSISLHLANTPSERSSSPSVVSPAHLSHSLLPGTASVKHLVINRLMKAPLYFPLVAHPSCLLRHPSKTLNGITPSSEVRQIKEYSAYYDFLFWYSWHTKLWLFFDIQYYDMFSDIFYIYTMPFFADIFLHRPTILWLFPTYYTMLFSWNILHHVVLWIFST